MTTMLRKMAWNTFKNTGNIDTMMELLEVNQLENAITQKTLEEKNIRQESNIDEKEKQKIGMKKDGDN